MILDDIQNDQLLKLKGYPHKMKMSTSSENKERSRENDMEFGRRVHKSAVILHIIFKKPKKPYELYSPT